MTDSGENVRARCGICGVQRGEFHDIGCALLDKLPANTRVGNEHVLAIGQDFADGTFCAECSCGWESDERNAEADALADWHEHFDGTVSNPSA